MDVQVPVKEGIKAMARRTRATLFVFGAALFLLMCAKCVVPGRVDVIVRKEIIGSLKSKSVYATLTVLG